MDTGLLYRAVALNLFRFGGDPGNEFEAVRACDLTSVSLDDPDLRSEVVGSIASRISAYPAVRERLLERQRGFAAQAGGAVLDGRDIGTVIAPDADVKLFVTAIGRGAGPAAGGRAAGARHFRPSRGRHHRPQGPRRARFRAKPAPLLQAEDALLLDTSDMDVDEAVAAAIESGRETIARPRR